METYDVLRDREPDLQFTGTRLGAASSQRRTDQLRWLEVEIFQTAGGKYVVAIIGRSLIDGETDRFDAHICTTAREVVDSLYRSERRCPNCGWTSKKPRCRRCEVQTVETGNRYLTSAARDALEQAADYNDEFNEALVVRLE